MTRHSRVIFRNRPSRRVFGCRPCLNVNAARGWDRDRASRMSSAWLEQRERGSLAALKLITWITTSLGYHAGRLALYPACLYFLLFSPKARMASRGYLRRVLAHPPALSDIFRHYHVFATTLLDRIELLANRVEAFDIRYHGIAEFQRYVGSCAGRGCLLIGAHLGSFELVRALASRDRGIIVNTVMFEENAAVTRRWMHDQSKNTPLNIIPAGQPDTLLRVMECLDRGEWVAMLADRPVANERTTTCEFLGAPAEFPTGPLLSAVLLKAPVVLFFALCSGARSYDVHLEMFDIDPAGFDRRHREQALHELIMRYVQCLEIYVRKAPHNWFNFYDFWRRL